MPNPLLIFPFGGNAREAAALIHNDTNLLQQWQIVAFMDDNPQQQGQEYLNIPVQSPAEALDQYPHAKVLAAVGNPNNYLMRRSIIDKLKLSEQRFAQIISSSAFIAGDAQIGTNVLIAPHVVVGAGARIGNHCIILANTTIAHDVHVEDFCCIGANVVISGSVKLEENSYVGSGTCIKDGITIGKKALLGLGSVVINNVEENTVVTGNPARELIRK